MEHKKRVPPPCGSGTGLDEKPSIAEELLDAAEVVPTNASNYLSVGQLRDVLGLDVGPSALG